MAAGKALSKAQIAEIIDRSARREPAQSIAVSMGISIGPVYSHVAKWRKRNGMKPLADEHALSRETRRTIIGMHRAGMLNREIAAELELSVSSIEKTLHDYRAATGERSRKDVLNEDARDRIDAIGQIFVEHDGEISAGKILEIAIETVPHPDGWTKQLIYSALDQWRKRMGIVAPCVARQELWEYIHQQMTTGYTAESIAAHLNDNRLGLVHGIPWTTNSVRVFHSDYAHRNGELISHIRTDEQVLEVSFRCALLRAESEHWTIVDMVDLFNETEYAFPPNGRPWTAKALYAAIHRAGKIIREIEDNQEMLKTVDLADNSFALSVVDADVPLDDAVDDASDDIDDDIDPSETDERHVSTPISSSDKTARLHAVANRIVDLRDEGAGMADIRSTLDAEYPRGGDGWQSCHVAAVEQYGRHVGIKRPERDFGEIGAVIESLHARMTVCEIANYLNETAVANAVVNDSAWMNRHVSRVLAWNRSQRKRKKRQITKREPQDDEFNVPIQHPCDGPTPTDKLLDRRRMRRSDELIREEARKKLAMRDAAFARAQEIHRQMQQLREDLAATEFTLDEINEAETLLIATGPPILQERLAKLRSLQRSESTDVSANAQEIQRVTRRIINEDWR